MEATIRVILGYILGLYWGYIAIMEKKMETTIVHFYVLLSNEAPLQGFTRYLACLPAVRHQTLGGSLSYAFHTTPILYGGPLRKVCGA